MQRHRPIIMALNGVVSSGHPLASQAGVRVMQEGGNAFDAIVAAAAVLAVCKPSMNGLGGDNMAVMWDARGQRLLALNSNGPAPAGATPRLYARGIPERGPLAMSVPGAVAGWDAILSRFGTRRLADLLEPAIGYAERGVPVNHRLHDEITQSEEGLRRWPESAAIFLPNGRVPRPTEVLRQPQLASSLRSIAAQGPAALYGGELGRRVGEFLAAHGGVLAAHDLDGFQPHWKEPIGTAYRGTDFYGQPPSSQGFIVAQELNVLEGFEVASLSRPALIHLMVEAKKLAFADRDRYLCDPAFHNMPIDQLISKERAEKQRRRIDVARAGVEPAALDLAPAGGETTYLCAIDGQGNAISFIQSLFGRFGSEVVAGDTGIVLNNRMRGFTAEPGHPNAVAPGKRPGMTLNACMLFRRDRPWVVFGTPGEDAQVQTNFQLAVDFVDFDMDVQAAIEAPRWRHQDGNRLLMEDRFPGEVGAALLGMGHTVVPGLSWDPLTGGAQAIMVDPETGVLQAGADPRREGYASGF
ncbi:MAG: gamma-glutamyltransferase [Chloroflexota bacterium]